MCDEKWDVEELKKLVSDPWAHAPWKYVYNESEDLLGYKYYYFKDGEKVEVIDLDEWEEGAE